MPPSKKKAGLEALMEAGLVTKGSDPKFVLHRIPFGIPDLDKIVNGGLPRKRVSILNGEWSCVAPETLIDTEFGRLPIKFIVDNRLSVRVWTFDVSRARWQLKPILRWWKQSQYDTLVQLGDLRLTPQHEIWTSEGYVPAREVLTFPARYSIIAARGKTDAKRDLFTLRGRSDHFSPSARLSPSRDLFGLYRLRGSEEDSFSRSALLQLRGEVAASSPSRLHCQVAHSGDTGEATKDLSRDDAGSCQSPLGSPAEPRGADKPEAEGVRSDRQALVVGGSGPSQFLAAGKAGGGFGVALAERVCGQDQSSLALACSLQDRYNPPRIEGCCRGWESRQSSQGVLVRGQWMDAAMVLQSYGGDLSGGLSSDGYVYDLTVADNHNYLADGILVANSGKSFLVQLLMKNVQAQGLSVAYIDTERGFDPDWWKQVGLDIGEVYVAQPLSGEAGINAALELAESGFDVVAIDSIAGLVPEDMIEEGAEKNFVALQARLVTRLMQKALTVPHNAAIVCTNQLRSHLGPGPIDAMPGGWAQSFFSHVLLRVYRESWIEEKGAKVGFNMKVICRKSKVGTPYGECTLPFRFRGDIDILALLAQRAIDGGFIEQAGPWYSILGGSRIQGMTAVLAVLQEDEELRRKLEASLGEVKAVA